MWPVMRVIASLLITLAIVFCLYIFYLKRLQPGARGSVTTQAISLTGVQGDLLAIAQAERMYFTQNNSYASLDELTASGTLRLARPGRDGYTYSVETSANSFTVTARYTGQPGDPPGAHHPTITVDQNMQVRQSP
jgi:Tfp pilus assembly protein PilE